MVFILLFFYQVIEAIVEPTTENKEAQIYENHSIINCNIPPTFNMC
jgi:hypothetical protein